MTVEGRRDRWKLLGVGGAALVLASGLAGCTSTEDSTRTDQTSTATPSASATLSERQQQIAAAEKALRDYVVAFDEASRTLNSDNMILMEMVTPEWWSEKVVPEFNQLQSLNLVQTGNVRILSTDPVKVELNDGSKSIQFRVCKDTANLRYVKAEGEDQGKVVYNPNKGDTPRFEMTYTFNYSEKLERWRLARHFVPLDENGENTPC